MKRSILVLATIAASAIWNGCTSSTLSHNTDHSKRQPSTLSPAIVQDRYLRDIHPIFANRCVVCHTCVDAPCQLHLESYLGLKRGATVTEMGSSVLETPPTRLKDAYSLTDWRQKGFFPVVRDEPKIGAPGEAQRNLEESLLYRYISLGMHNQSRFDLDALDEHREENHSCVYTVGQFEQFAKKYPAAGMPYGLPALDEVSFNLLKSWIADGSPGPSRQATWDLLTPSRPEQIEEWESILNGSQKAKLTGRFIYEHSFSTHIHFEGTPDDEFYELVRSRTAFPHNVVEIVTPRPYDPPNIEVHYRFRRLEQTVVRKTHILWELSRADYLSIKQMFIESPWGSKKDSEIVDPGYSSTNPFEYFKQIPADIRYKFMLQNSRMIVNAMVRGPVCVGKLATSAIRDNFWVFFIKPSSDVTVMDPNIGYYEWSHLGDKLSKSMTSHSKDYITAMQKYRPQGYSLDDIWDGDGNNPNALITILRHETSVTVHYGPQGGLPATLWVMNFSNLERIYYNLVPDYMPWGNIAHKLATWEYMSFHRQEGEERFISLFPPEFRDPIRDSWTKGVGSIENFFKKKYSEGIASQFQVNKNLPLESMVNQLLARMPDAVKNKVDTLTPYPFKIWEAATAVRNVQDWEQSLASMSGKYGMKFAHWLPNITYVRFEDRAYSLITHRAYEFDNIPGVIDSVAIPDRDQVAVFHGIYGDIPEMFFDISTNRATQFLSDLSKMRSAEDWTKLKETYGMRRNDPKFWSLLDWFHQWDQHDSPLEAGIFDVSHYDID